MKPIEKKMHRQQWMGIYFGSGQKDFNFPVLNDTLKLISIFFVRYLMTMTMLIISEKCIKIKQYCDVYKWFEPIKKIMQAR